MDNGSARISRRRLVRGVGLLAGTLAVGCGPLPFQQPSPTPVKVHRLGFLSGTQPAASVRTDATFRQALSELGYVEGKNLVIENRWAEGSTARLAEHAAELVRLPVDVIVVPSERGARSAREATTAVPIVMAGPGDPVVAGLAESYARPGGNVTGVINPTPLLFGKRLHLLKEAVPSISRVAVFGDAESSTPSLVEAWYRDARAVGVQLHPLLLHGPEEFDDAFEAAARDGADSLLLVAITIGAARRPRIIQHAARLGWPAMYFERQMVDEGGLMAYEGSHADRWQRAAAHVDKILKGAKPADIPIEQPMRFDFVVNLTTAEALGLSFPEATRLQVTEIVR